MARRRIRDFPPSRRLPAPDPSTLTCLAIIPPRSGYSLIHSILGYHSHVAWRSLYRDDQEEPRRQEADDYFGYTVGDLPVRLPMTQYMMNALVDRTARHEKVVVIATDLVNAELLLDSAIHELSFRGRFCAIRVDRNPISSIVSQELVRKGGPLTVNPGGGIMKRPRGIFLDDENLSDQVREYNRRALLIDRLMDRFPAVRINFSDLVNQFDKCAAGLYKFLGVPGVPASPMTGEIYPGWTIGERIVGLSAVAKLVTPDIASLLKPEILV